MLSWYQHNVRIDLASFLNGDFLNWLAGLAGLSAVLLHPSWICGALSSEGPETAEAVTIGATARKWLIWLWIWYYWTGPTGLDWTRRRWWCLLSWCLPDLAGRLLLGYWCSVYRRQELRLEGFLLPTKGTITDIQVNNASAGSFNSASKGTAGFLTVRSHPEYIGVTFAPLSPVAALWIVVLTRRHYWWIEWCWKSNRLEWLWLWCKWLLNTNW